MGSAPQTCPDPIQLCLLLSALCLLQFDEKLIKKASTHNISENYRLSE
jgi:hypothetical protein